MGKNFKNSFFKILYQNFVRMSTGPSFSMPARLELRWKGRTPPDASGNGTQTWDISGAWDISGGSCCKQIEEIDIYVKALVSILGQINTRGDIQTADNRLDLLTSTLTTRLGKLP
jgi:hypothetical protein